MRVTTQRILAAAVVLAMTALGRQAAARTSPSATGVRPVQAQLAQSPSPVFVPKSPPPENPASSPLGPAPSPLFDFKDSDIKFSLGRFMTILRDRNHEDWVLTAYPDPNTSRPLIGAGFSLDVAATEHIQSDPLNPHQFLEPSSAQLWQAAGLDFQRLQKILDRFNHNLNLWGKKKYRQKIKAHALPPQLSAEEATSLLHLSAIQAIHNARAYCRDFEQLTAPQQMALSQLVFQMGVNLEEFVEFLGALNDDPNYRDAEHPDGSTETDAEHWKTVQSALIDSQWARRYTIRAATVIAMFDPDYVEDPKGAERRVQATLHPSAKHHTKKPRGESVRAGNTPAK